MKVLVGAFNQEKALVGAFSVIVQTVVEPMDRFAALLTTYLTTYLATYQATFPTHLLHKPEDCFSVKHPASFYLL